MATEPNPAQGKDRFYCAFCGLRGEKEIKALCPRSDGVCAARLFGQKKATS